MKKFYFLTMLTGLLFFSLSSATAQEFPWPDLGEAMVIEPGEPGKINDVIHGDTTENGERVHQHYILKRGATYLYTARIQNDGYPLMVTAEAGDGPFPIIKALGPAAGEDEAERIFHAQGDLYIKDLVLSGWDQGGNYTDNATVRMAADEITVVCNNIAFDFNRQNTLRINSRDCKLYVENCIIGNQGVAARLWQGFAVHFRGNWTPLVHMRNNTIYNMHHTVIENRNEARYGKFIFEQNTVVNTGTGGAYFGRPDSLIVKNNLFVNVGIIGDGLIGDRDDFTEPHYYFVVDSTFTDETNTTLVDPYVDFTNNHYYLDPAVAGVLPDSSDKSTETLFNPYLSDLMNNTTNVVKDEAFTFENFPATTSMYEAYVNDFYSFSDDPAELPLFDTDFRTLDFTYSETLDAYSAGTDGGPLGDRGWNALVGISNENINRNFDVYPNPATEFVQVRVNKNTSVDKVVILNIMGQEMRQVSGIEGKSSFNINTSDLDRGIYFINFYNNGEVLNTNKILKH